MQNLLETRAAPAAFLLVRIERHGDWPVPQSSTCLITPALKAVGMHGLRRVRPACSASVKDCWVLTSAVANAIVPGTPLMTVTRGSCSTRKRGPRVAPHQHSLTALFQ